MPVACAGHNEMKNTPEQMFQVLVACQEPKFPSQVDVAGLNPFNGEDQAQKQKIFENLNIRGFLQLVQASDGRRTPAGWVITPKGAAERDLLRRLLGARAK
jgi:hypothetical protein